METRANYLIVGAFTLAGFAALMGFLLWFARVELDRQFAYYDVNFPSVSGLSNASQVRFSGLPVGQVVDVALDPSGSGMVRVRIEVQADTPVRTSSVATIEALGVTGTSYLAIAAGAPDAPLLRAASPDPVPDIPSRPSSLQALSESAPEILEEILQVSRSVSRLVGPENQERFANILANAERASAQIDRALQDFSSATANIAQASGDIAGFTGRLETVAATAETTLVTADAALRQVAALAIRAEATFDAGDAALRGAEATFRSAEAFIEKDLAALATELETTAATLRRGVDTIGGEAAAMLGEFRSAGALAGRRLEEAEETVSAANRALDEATTAAMALAEAATRAEALIAGDGAAAVAEARALIASADQVVAAAASLAETDLPEIMADIRSASAVVARVVETVGARLSDASGRTDDLTALATEALQTALGTFERANETLSSITTAVDRGGAALAAAEGVIATADRILGEEVSEMATSLRATLGRLEAAMLTVSEDAPAITSELRQAVERANTTFRQVEAASDAIGPPLRAFAAEGLPEYARLARESRDLIANLQQLVRRLEQDPARFLLGREAPAFRR
jgi:phospholipid/cholesterol/gamma-HCH transport system substrate-binding protein